MKKLASNKNSSKGNRPYELPVGLDNITTSIPPLPDVELVKKDLDQLKTGFFEHKMAEYIDIYRGNHAMMKFIYHFEKYIDPQTKGRCRKWCDDFNYANHALELITKKKDTFVPVKEEDKIQFVIKLWFFSFFQSLTPRIQGSWLFFDLLLIGA